MDGTSLSNNVLTLYDTANGSITQPYVPQTVATWTQSTDFGATVPAACFKDGSVVATLATLSANTKLGVPFADGLLVVKSGDVTNAAVLKLGISPLIKKSINLSGEAGTVPVFDGPGIVHAVRITLPSGATTGSDITFTDGANTVITASNYGAAGNYYQKIWSPVTTTGVDDAGSAVTTAATGAYTNQGVAFFTNLKCVLAQGTASNLEGHVDVLIEA
jgi:hypothetical protein